MSDIDEESNTPPGSQFHNYYEMRASLRRGVPEAEFTAKDCQCLSPLPNADGILDGELWISSPNMCWCPVLPSHSNHQPFAYYADGMLGPFEFMKWPQVWYDAEPHCVASPGDPQLMQFGISYDDGPSFPVEDHLILPQYDDPDIAWIGYREHFEVIESYKSLPIGTLTPKFLQRMERALLEAQRMAEEGFQARFDAAYAGMYRVAYCAAQILRVLRAR